MTVTTDPLAVLDRTRQLTVPALHTAVQRLEPQIARVASYHLGWCDESGSPVEGHGGKALRPALALLSAEAVQAPPRVALPGAVAVELVHSFSLVHDDLMDGDEERRHRPTAWKVFGPSMAVLAGDALLTAAVQTLHDVPGEAGRQAAQQLADATRQLIEGQSQDLAFERRVDVSAQECLQMAGGKTGALLACAASIGSVLAAAPESTQQALSGFGYHLGLAFQAVDDVLGIWGDPARTGKPAWSDLRQRKKTVPVTVALSDAGAAGAHLRQLLSGGALRDEGELALAAHLVEEAGGHAWTIAEAERHQTRALDFLNRVSLAEGARQELVALAEFVTRREL